MLPKLLTTLFKTAPPASVTYIVVQLNDKITPFDKAKVYAQPLAAFLDAKGYGEISGGGTAKEEQGEILFCDIQIELATEALDDEMVQDIIRHLEACGAPRGSKIIVEETNEEILFGKKEGLAFYLDSETLEYYEADANDIDFIQKEMYKLTDANQDADRYLEDATSIALYFYGATFEEMERKSHHFRTTYPLCQKARIVQIA